jgi:DNA polymerase-3 subunit alpha
MRDILRRYTTQLRFTAPNAPLPPWIQGGMLDDFISEERKAIAMICISKDILEETYGVIFVSEQVMQIASRVAGYSLGEADILRRAMGKKKARRWRRSRAVSGRPKPRIPQRKVENL